MDSIPIPSNAAMENRNIVRRLNRMNGSLPGCGGTLSIGCSPTLLSDRCVVQIQPGKVVHGKGRVAYRSECCSIINWREKQKRDRGGKAEKKRRRAVVVFDR